ncbi:MAG: hypothetical protein JRJ85_28270 [Deltaproteobacteria bacterium]|nr:hypothetical protein [Deltaproteobacteria bacterium]
MIGLIYQPLYMIDREKDILIPWLAENHPDFDSEEKTVTFRLREMKWDDGTEFTADDVVFTAQVIKKFKVPRYYAYWEFVDKIEAVDKRTVRLTLNRPMAVLSLQGSSRRGNGSRL